MVSIYNVAHLLEIPLEYPSIALLQFDSINIRLSASNMDISHADQPHQYALI